jgi:flagellar biosynthesis GTPase FlhF
MEQDDDDGAELKEWADEQNFQKDYDVEDPDDDNIERSLDHNFVDGHVCEYQHTVQQQMFYFPEHANSINGSCGSATQCAHNAIKYLSKLDPADMFSKCMLLKGKGGTGKTTTINMVT